MKDIDGEYREEGKKRLYTLMRASDKVDKFCSDQRIVSISGSLMSTLSACANAIDCEYLGDKVDS